MIIFVAPEQIKFILPITDYFRKPTVSNDNRNYSIYPIAEQTLIKRRKGQHLSTSEKLAIRRMIADDGMDIKNVWMIYNLSIQTVKRILKFNESDISSNFIITEDCWSKVIESEVVKKMIISYV